MTCRSPVVDRGCGSNCQSLTRQAFLECVVVFQEVIVCSVHGDLAASVVVFERFESATGHGLIFHGPIIVDVLQGGGQHDGLTACHQDVTEWTITSAARSIVLECIAYLP